MWELCRNCYDKFGMKPEDACWELGEFDPFFGWLCHQDEDLSIVLQTTANLSCMYSTRALFHLMKEAMIPCISSCLTGATSFLWWILLPKFLQGLKFFARNIFMSIGIRVAVSTLL